MQRIDNRPIGEWCAISLTRRIGEEARPPSLSFARGARTTSLEHDTAPPPNPGTNIPSLATTGCPGPPVVAVQLLQIQGVDVSVCDLDEHIVFRGNYREFRTTREFQRLFVSTVLRGTENFHCHRQISHSQIPQRELGVELAVRCAIANRHIQ